MAHDALAFDRALKERYLDCIRRGMSESAARTHLSISHSALRRYLTKDPDFARAEQEARREANDAVEDALYALATGRRTPQEAEHYALNPPDDPPPPPRPDRQAALSWLERRSPERWRPDPAAHPGSTQVNVAVLSTPEGAQVFREELLRRKQETAAVTETTPVPETGRGL